ncbi:hypothetical protein AWJ20_2753 [Sugiyamaella lignohabitans]|uniref:Uncharacterized protein n=1 Tax=Sugiyamaella lignohabitans TaxID=796027 RepID=A0A167FCV5_9ASCO|nr:uncharacterized protein AWJ20_2753 [Sugiyamaella lignohabitans]ANB15132.1 hypothetical protein AWJ20_2753 [Sugiyamaella lignohabitans]
MTSKLINHFVGKELQHAFGAEDPYYFIVEETDTKGKVTSKKVKKEIPKGLSNNDINVLKAVKRRAYYYELVFNLCGFNCGITVLIGLIPFIGWAINLYLGLQTINKCEKIDGGLPNWERSKMMANLVADAGLGFVPVAGDLAAAVYKSNTRNSALLEKFLKKRGLENLQKNGQSTTSEKHHWLGGGANKAQVPASQNATVTAPNAVHTASAEMVHARPAQVEPGHL